MSIKKKRDVDDYSNNVTVVFSYMIKLYVCICFRFRTARPCTKTRQLLQTTASKVPKLFINVEKNLNFINMFKITLKNAFRYVHVQTCLVLVNYFVKYTLTFQKFERAQKYFTKTNVRVLSIKHHSIPEGYQYS